MECQHSPCAKHIARTRHRPQRRPPSFAQPLGADSTVVPAQQPQGSSTATCAGRFSLSCLIPLWFPRSNFRLLHSSRSGVVCRPTPDAAGSASFGMLVLTRNHAPPQTARPPPKRRSAAGLCFFVIRTVFRKDSLSEADCTGYEQKIRDAQRQRIDDGGDIALRPVNKE